MLAAFLTIALSNPGTGCNHAHPSLRGLSPRIEAIVDAAWQEAAKPEAAKPGQDPAKDNSPEARHQRDIESDKALGRRYSEMADKELKASKNVENLARLQRIGAEIAAIANQATVEVTWGDKRLSPFDYTFKLVEGEDVNAFSLPGGYIYFYDGLLKYAESDDELAGVIAHEISHAAFRHVATLQREQSKLNAVQLPLILIAILSGSSGAADVAQLGNLIGTATGSGWSQKAELAADYGGLQFLAKSKYDATGMLTFMERLARDERNRPVSFDWGIYRTHPPSRERAETITRNMRAANIPIRRSRVSASFRSSVKPGENGVVNVEFGGRVLVSFAGSEALVRADQASKDLDAFFDSVPELYEVQMGENGWILGRRDRLFQLNHEDATAAKVELPTLKEQTVRQIRQSLFSLGYRIWETR